MLGNPCGHPTNPFDHEVLKFRVGGPTNGDTESKNAARFPGLALIPGLFTDKHLPDADFLVRRLLLS